MKARNSMYLGVAAIAIALAVGVAPTPVMAQQAATVSIGATDIGGVVSGPKGPEAGVWVIAETTDLPTKMNKTVVTDDQGRYLIPDLPKANYVVWARGYGLVDSAKTTSEPGKIVNITAVPAPNEAAAAEYYPAIYWFSMLKIPGKEMFPGTGPNGNGMATTMKSQLQWTDQIKTNGCFACHAVGTKATRTIPEALGTFKNSVEAWERRIQSGQAMIGMAAAIGRQDPKISIANFADWTDRIKAGELPFAKPERPQGLERNVVITQWDWGDAKSYMHDQVSTDKRKPTINAYGKHFGATEESTDWFPVFDPATNQPSKVNMPVRDSGMESTKNNTMAPSAYWGEEAIWDSKTSVHSLIMDEKTQVWFTSRVGKPENPAFCQAGSDHPSAKAFPLKESTRHLAVYDPKTNTTKLIRTCYNTHHVVLAEDADNTVWISQGGPQQGVMGWLNRRIWEETGDEAKAQGWAPIIIDTNGNGKADEYVQPNQAVDPAKDKRLNAGLYGVGVNPSDGTVWGAVLGYPGYVLRYDPQTKLSEVYEPPFPGFGPRGFDIDRNGIAYVPLSSGHLGAFDRRKCKGPLNGPQAAEGKLCPEGWTLTPFPGPQFKNVAESGSAEASYYTWVDQQNTLGLGNNVPLATGNANESLMALVDGKWVNMRMPYPLGFFAKWIDGRIDDPNAGWKGRGLWTTDGNRTPFHRETGKGTTPKITKFQMRPDPLAN
ncbi:MAG TPA: carboxypeptidase regulatory-like domain-containing protein [Xanthobacteraceae bacterium]|nr:carboxypeptidase regulatory-like domain-containing protein [Xanthobacteraceae bacterium]